MIPSVYVTIEPGADPRHVVTRCLNSNGRPVTPEVALALVGLADEVRVSIDALEERNDRLRASIEIPHVVVRVDAPAQPVHAAPSGKR